MHYIETKKGLETLLKRYQEAGVTDQTKDASGGYEAKWISTIKGCIEEGLAMDEVDLVFEEDAYELIAEKALKKDTGARALRSIIEDFMLDIMYEIPKDPNIGRVVITREYIEGTGGPRIEMRGAE